VLKLVLTALFTCKQELEVLVFLRKNTFSVRTGHVKLVAAERIQHPIQLNDFLPASPRDFQSPAGYDNGFVPLQIDDGFAGLLLAPSPSLGSASIDILDMESCELNVDKLIKEAEDADFWDINNLVPNIS
jgi:hypothetical protein